MNSIVLFFRNLFLFFLSIPLAILIWLIHKTLRVEIRGLTNISKGFSDDLNGPLLAFYHGRQFYMFSLKSPRKLVTLTSLSRDGQLQTYILRWFGIKSVRGSSSREGARGLLALLRMLKKGYATVVAVDGPRGPARRVRGGIIQLARHTGAPILPMSAAGVKVKIFHKAWDKYQLPKPFSQIVVVVDEPIFIGPKKERGQIEKEQQYLQERLKKITLEAEHLCLHKL